MSRIARLLAAYEAQLRLAWEPGLHGAERTWFVVYPPLDERRLRTAIGEFELATLQSRRRWILCDLTQSFEVWLAASEYREEYFADPDFLTMQYAEFEAQVTRQLRDCCSQADESTVVAVLGVGSLFGFARVSNVVSGAADAVLGRLVVFFPGSVESNTYRLLNARDGWNYRAVPITVAH
jgi:bacteriophage exclusion system BrxB-like protein